MSYLSLYKETIEYGLNFLEPSPDIIEEQLKWKVKAIVRMHYYNCKKQLQYQVHWKDYSDPEDTWKSKKNIHTSKLIEQYHQRQGISIRAARILTSKSIFPN